MDKTPKKPPNNEEPQPYQSEEQARIAKLAAEEALIRERLERARLHNEAAVREARAWHARYTFVPSPRLALQAIGALIVLVLASFVLYEPLVERITHKATIAKLEADIQNKTNQKLEQELDERKKELQSAKQALQAQEARYTADLKKLAAQRKSLEDELNARVRQTQAELQERTVEISRLTEASEAEKPAKARFLQMAQKERARAEELEKQLEKLQAKAQKAKEQTAQVQREVEARPGRIFRDSLKIGGKGPEMIVIAAGSFLMGSPATEKSRDKDEGPQRRVTISRPFALSTREITFAEYDLFAKATGRRLPDDEGWGRGSRPVINVSWDDATAYAGWLSEQTGQRYRLPTEAEWEYACRAGSSAAYSFGDDPNKLGEYAWFDANSNGKTQPVGNKKKNAWSLYDIHGNVWEWCQDRYGEYPSNPEADPIGPKTGESRALRGGSWSGPAVLTRCADRDYGSPYGRSDVVGFRCARALK